MYAGDEPPLSGEQRPFITRIKSSNHGLWHQPRLFKPGYHPETD